METGTKLREEFAKICFEVLLQFSLLHEEQNEIAKSTSQITNQLAITSLLDRFHNVLSTFVQDAKNSGKCPLPRLVTVSFSISFRGVINETEVLESQGAYLVSFHYFSYIFCGRG